MKTWNRLEGEVGGYYWQLPHFVRTVIIYYTRYSRSLMLKQQLLKYVD